MKRICLPLLLCCCLLLTGCGEDRKLKKQYEDFSAALAARESLELSAALRTEYEDRSADFRLACQIGPEEAVVTVREPAIIAGVSATVRPDGSCLACNGIILDTGPLDAYGLSPLTALPALADMLKNGHLDSCWQADGQPVLRLVRDDHLSAEVRFDPAFQRPLYAELFSDGRVTVCCTIEEWK